MNPQQLGELRKFFVCIEGKLPEAIAMMYDRFLVAVPEAKHLFRGNVQEQQGMYLRMLREVVRLTRSSHLWPVQAFSGTASIPAMDKLGIFHARLNLTPWHFQQMKVTLSDCFREHCDKEFTPGAEAALGFIFDVFAKATAHASKATSEQMASKNKLPGGDAANGQHENFASFFGTEAMEGA